MSEDLKRDMIHMQEDPQTITEFVTGIQRLDNRRRAFQQESCPSTRFNTTNSTTTTNFQRTLATAPAPAANPRTSTATGTQPGPMEFSANRNCLTPEERQRRMVEGRCIYCRGLGHMAVTYPIAPCRPTAAEGFTTPVIPFTPNPFSETPADVETLN